MQCRAKFPFLSSVKLIETNISMDLDLETGYHMSNMENIDIMSLLLNIYIRYLLLLLLQHFVVIYIDCAIS